MDRNRKTNRRWSRAIACALLGAAAAGVAVPATAGGSVVISQVGDQDFYDRQSPVPVWQIRILGEGEPPPFDGSIFGDDRKPGRMGSVAYAHRFEADGATPDEAWLTVGLIDHDSPEGDRRGTVALFLDGVLQPADAFRGISNRSTTGSAHVVTVPVPPDLLADGELLVRFETTRPAQQFKGNSLQIDFSKLKINGEPDQGPMPAPNPIPLPNGGTAGAVVILCWAGWSLLRRRVGNSIP